MIECFLILTCLYVITFSGKVLQNLQDPEKFSIFENGLASGTSGSKGSSYVVFEGDNVVVYVDAFFLFGFGFSQSLLYAGLKIDNSVAFERIHSVSDNSGSCFALKVYCKTTAFPRSNSSSIHFSLEKTFKFFTTLFT